MEYSPARLWPFLICLCLFSCRSKENAEPGEPVFGIYRLKIKGKTTIELKTDSTVLMDLSYGVLEKKLNTVVKDKEGVFTMRNDSIFITWSDGNSIKSKFQRKKNFYSFLNGSTTYERKL